MSWPTENALGIIARTPGVIRSMVDGLAPELIEAGSLQTWGPREVVEHLLDVEGIALRERISRTVHEDRPFIRSIDPPGRLEEGDYKQHAFDVVLSELARQRNDDVAWLRTLAPTQLERSGEHDTAGTITARQLINYWACHDLLHLRQLTRALQSRFEPHIGGMRLFLEEE